MSIHILSYLFLGLGTLIFLVAYLNLAIKCLKSKSIEEETFTAYDLAKRIIDNNNLEDVTIIETKENPVNVYNTKRNVIKLSEETYYSSTTINLAIAAHTAIYALEDKQEIPSFIYLKKVLTNFTFICQSNFLSLLLSLLMANYANCRLGLILLIAIFIYQSLVKNIENINFSLVTKEFNNVEELTPKEQKSILSILKSVDHTYNITLIITILQLCRMFIYLIM